MLKDLDRYFTLQLQVAGTIHLAHSALAKQRCDLVGAELRADGQGHDFGRGYTTADVSGRETA
jgi:hypothetical protein